MMINILNESAIGIPARSTSTCRMDITPTERDKLFIASSMVLYNNRAIDYSPAAATNKVGIGISDLYLTGKTGDTGKVTVAHNPSGGNPPYQGIFFENRSGATITLMVTIDSSAGFI